MKSEKKYDKNNKSENNGFLRATTTILVAIIFAFASNNEVKAQCPQGANWQQESGQIQISADCWLEFDYCWRMSNTGKEMYIGTMRLVGTHCNVFQPFDAEEYKYFVELCAVEIIKQSHWPGNLFPCDEGVEFPYIVGHPACVTDKYLYDWVYNPYPYMQEVYRVDDCKEFPATEICWTMMRVCVEYPSGEIKIIMRPIPYDYRCPVDKLVYSIILNTIRVNCHAVCK